MKKQLTISRYGEQLTSMGNGRKTAMTLFSLFSESYAYNRTAGGRIKWEEDNRSGLGFEPLMSLNFSVYLFATTTLGTRGFSRVRRDFANKGKTWLRGKNFRCRERDSKFL